jgi:hypothetical protein
MRLTVLKRELSFLLDIPDRECLGVTVLLYISINVLLSDDDFVDFDFDGALNIEANAGVVFT